MRVFVLKEGKEYNQGVAYLDDGTMVVVENGHDYIGEYKEVVVTKVLQTAAGRMIFARVTEGGVAEVVPEADGLGQDFVEAQRLRDRARDLRHLQHVCEPGPVVISFRRQKDLCLVLQPPECLAVDDAVAVPLV